MFQRQYLIHLSLVVIALVIIIYPYLNRKPDAQKVEVASAAALSFLALLDAEDYERGWHSSSAFMKSEISLDLWRDQLAQMRQQTGTPQQRTRTSVSYTKEEVEGIPEGEYMSFFYTTDFDGKKTVRERVTLILEEDAVWRVAGYFVE